MLNKRMKQFEEAIENNNLGWASDLAVEVAKEFIGYHLRLDDGKHISVSSLLVAHKIRGNEFSAVNCVADGILLVEMLKEESIPCL